MDYIYFFSSAKYPYHLLSNFSEVKIEYKGITYPSVEHAWQAQLRDDKNEFSIENVDYDDSAYSYYWKNKKNIGILAKKSKTYKNKINNGREIWINILTIKYSQEPFRQILLDTNDSVLIEFDRRSSEEKPSIWGAKEINGKIIGGNAMGKYLMEIRDKIKK